MIRLLLFFLFVANISNGALSAQDYIKKDNLDKRSQKRYAQAESYSRMQAFAEAKAELDEILVKEPKAIDALLFRAQMLTELKQWSQAEADIELALALSIDYYPPALYQLGLIEREQEKYTEAITHFEDYLEQASDNDRRRARVENYLSEARVAARLREKVVNFEPTSLGDSINTTRKEYLPSFTADGKFLIYTVRYHDDEDFFYSSKNAAGNWQKAQPLEAVNTELSEGGSSISADGRLLFFTGCYRPGSLGGCDLYYTEMQNGEWQSLRHPGAPINSAHWDSQPSLSANGRYLYFASDRPGGLGGNDIWRSTRLADGSWGKPQNLGAPINTPGNDESPFIHADGQTLYFMSDGHPGLGDYDLFYARLDTGGSWQTPENMGYPINTAAAEGALVVSLDGKTAYYTTDENTKEGERQDFDIYQFPLYEAARPKPVTYLSGKVVDAKKKKALSGASIRLSTDSSAKEIAALETDTDGHFLLVLPAGYNYRLNVGKEGYLFYSDRFELVGDFTRDNPYELEVGLQLLPVEGLASNDNKPVVLHNVLFATASADLLPSSRPELDRLAALLIENTALRVRINGHTDNVGDQADNQQLSEDRAKAVYDYLIQLGGVAADRLTYRGFGESQPLESNDTDEGRQRNRRTEFELVKEIE
jgi:outer membrane protein OmpA-like peptidoglycan-associated protein/Tol biopolymer transport system component